MIRRIASGGVYEPRIGYCRAVVAGGFIHVSGTVAGPDVPDDVVAQCQSALGIMERALAEAGASFADALRVRYICPTSRILNHVGLFYQRHLVTIRRRPQ